MVIHAIPELDACLKDQWKRCKLSQAEVAAQASIRQKTVPAFENKPDSTKLYTFFRIL
jgi:HTH-type transcriptional regulator / antitoxin HipB